MVRHLAALCRAYCLPFLLVMALASGVAAESNQIVNKASDGIAISGYDTVGYFTEGRAMKGSPEFEYTWQDAKWLFATSEHRDLFAQDPERYAPRFGGFCTGAMSLGLARLANPENWSIIDGKLYMNMTRGGRDRLRASPDSTIDKAEETWAKRGYGHQ